MRSRGVLARPVVLSHHSVGAVDEDVDPNRLVVSPANLASQIRWLKKLGYRFTTAADIIDPFPPPAGTAVVTFDDGWLDGLTIATPLLHEHGIRATFFVCPGLWGQQHPDVAGDGGHLLTRDQARALFDAGMDLGAHSLTHRDLRELNEIELQNEVQGSKAAIEDVTGVPCRTFAYPFGLYGQREIEAAATAGYELAFAWRPGPWSRLAVPRLPAPPRHGGGRLVLKLFGVRRRIDLA